MRRVNWDCGEVSPYPTIFQMKDEILKRKKSICVSLLFRITLKHIMCFSLKTVKIRTNLLVVAVTAQKYNDVNKDHPSMYPITIEGTMRHNIKVELPSIMSQTSKPMLFCFFLFASDRSFLWRFHWRV